MALSTPSHTVLSIQQHCLRWIAMPCQVRSGPLACQSFGEAEGSVIIPDFLIHPVGGRSRLLPSCRMWWVGILHWMSGSSRSVPKFVLGQCLPPRPVLPTLTIPCQLIRMSASPAVCCRIARCYPRRPTSHLSCIGCRARPVGPVGIVQMCLGIRHRSQTAAGMRSGTIPTRQDHRKLGHLGSGHPVTPMWLGAPGGFPGSWSGRVSRTCRPGGFPGSWPGSCRFMIAAHPGGVHRVEVGCGQAAGGPCKAA